MSLKCTLVATLWVSASSAAMWKLQVTNSSHPCCRWHWFPPRRDHQTSAVWFYHEDWWLLHGAALVWLVSMSMVKVTLPEGPSPPSHCWQSVIPVPSIPILAKLSVSPLWDPSFRWEERRAGGKQSSAMLCHHWKVRVQPWVTSTACRT